MKITIDPRLKFNYASWYLLGIEQLALAESKQGRQVTVEYDVAPFKDLAYNNMQDYNSGFAFVVRENGYERKVFVDTEDVAKVFPDRYKWCDVYGMVNPTREQVEEYDKLVAIGPEFGMPLHGYVGTVARCLKMYMKGRRSTHIPFKLYLRDYIYTVIRRRKLERYEEPTEVRKNYVYHASTLWYNEFAGTDTNRYRGEFLLACQRAGLEIEGGLFYVEGEAPLREMPDYPKYKETYRDFIYDKRLPMDDYVQKTKESVCVFNTPSVCACHGWKLAEYLCMGKAIISTPLSREMPGEGLVHGKNVHFVNTIEEIYDAVVKINNDDEYRMLLEKGAREYYEEWIAPDVVIKRLIG